MGRIAYAPFGFVSPPWRNHLEVQVLFWPDKGNRQPDGKGVHREVESEGSRRHNKELMNRNRIRGDYGG